ncbi:DUF3077 domain-containing protein [Pseudomonas huanghezhanensis]|uniref:DUF3077 domain-containing protein n=1 Tax=Pseudomonas huanghezhanensis TaxID=3002903 RepID=UPI0022862E6A|nr:DUF3077 domain-containing protein [Pseudomonas sp. BSw22131]
MSQPKNTTGSVAAQCPLEKFEIHPSSFGGTSERPMFQLQPGTSAGEALQESSSLMAGALAIIEHYVDEPGGANGSVLFAIGFVLEGAKALLDGGTYGIQQSQVHGGAK